MAVSSPRAKVSTGPTSELVECVSEIYLNDKESFLNAYEVF